MSTHPDGGDAWLDFGYGGVNPGQYLLTYAHGANVPSSPVGVASVTDQSGTPVHIMRGPNGKPLAITRGDGEAAFYVPDRLGSIIGLIDASGAKIVSYAYDPYGNLRSAPGTDANLAWANPLMYTGALKDFPTGLYRMGVRWYDPNTARFTTPDPTAQEKNAYQYAEGNSCNKHDAVGASAAQIGCAFAGALLGADVGVAAGAGAALAGLTLGAGLAVGAAVGIGASMLGSYACKDVT